MGFKFAKRDIEELDFPRFFELLMQKKDGVTNDMDDCYLSKAIRTHPDARQWYRVIKDLYPGARMRIVCKNRLLVNCSIVLVVVLVSAIGLYAIFHTPEKARARKRNNHGFYQMRMIEVLDSAQKVYNEKMILDQPEIGEERCSGLLDPEIPLKKFLSDVILINNLEYYYDSTAVIHIRRKEDS
jgi:hypothetical protein